MEEWKEYKLGDVLTIKYGKDHKQLADGDIPIYGSGGIMRYGERSLYDGPSILIPRKGSLNNIMYSDKPFWTVDTMFWSIINNTVANPLFVYYSICKKDFASLNVGSAVPSLTVPVIEDIDILLPSLAEQKQIVSILKSLDDKIEVNRRINENLEQQAQALFNEVLMDTKLPRNRLLKDYAFVNPTRTIKKGKIARYIDMSSLPTKGSFPSDWVDKPYNGGMKFQNGDTLMARITPCLENGKTAYINFLNKDEIAFGSTEYIVMAPHDGIPSEMFYFLARNEDLVSYAVAHMNGSSGRQRVSASDIENYIMPDIPPHQIEQFGMKAKAIMEKIKTNSLESRSLAELRDTLLPKLMSGELKVNEIA